MKFTNQPTTEHGFVQYSKPYTKAEIAELYTRIFTDIPERLKTRFMNKFCAMPDATLVHSFNKSVNVKIRVFGPNMYQIKYNGTHVFN